MPDPDRVLSGLIGASRSRTKVAPKVADDVRVLGGLEHVHLQKDLVKILLRLQHNDLNPSQLATVNKLGLSQQTGSDRA